MRLASIITFVIAMALSCAACTSVERSDEYRCAVQADCDPLGRICMNGWCVINTTLPPDALPQLDAAQDAVAVSDAPDQCPAQCSSCLGDGTCVIQCTTFGACDAVVLCPPNVPCEIVCGDFNCTEDIDCTAASSCDITCEGAGSCAGAVNCGTGPCNVTCSGANSCANNVECPDACSCQTTCSGTNSCAGIHYCPRDNQCKSGSVCQDSTGPCNRC